jgi:hypothetical protein
MIVIALVGLVGGAASRSYFVVCLVFPVNAGLLAWFAALRAIAGPGGSPRT